MRAPVVLLLLLAAPGWGWGAGFSVSSVTPPKVFTPNGDGCNDIVTIRYAGSPGPVVTGKIYDIRGRSVADLKPSSDFSSLSFAPACTAPYLGSDALAWDGKDSGGNLAPKGVYVYQLVSQGKVVQGTVVVAR